VEPRTRVLIVDDDKVITSALRRVLSGEHDVTVMNDPALALSLLRDGQRFHVILCDLVMPVMNGVQLHKEIAAIAPDQAAATILMTGGAIPRDAADLVAGGMPNLPKPFDIDRLRELIRQLRSDVPGRP
jgi:DNA-binding NtrC family response regulator